MFFAAPDAAGLPADLMSDAEGDRRPAENRPARDALFDDKAGSEKQP